MRDAGCLHTYVPVDISEEITHETAAPAGRGVPGPGGPRPRLRLRAAPRADSRRRRRPPDRLPRRHDRQPLPAAAPRLPRPPRGADGARGPAPARHRPGQGTRAPRGRLRRRRRRHRRVQQERPARCSTASSAPTSTSTPSSTSPATTQARRGWTSACARSRRRRCGSTASTWRSSFAAGEEMRTEISAKFTRERLDGVYAEAGLAIERLVHRRRLRLRAQPRPARLASGRRLTAPARRSARRACPAS